MTDIPLLDVKDLTVQFATRRGTVTAVRSVNVSVAKGETVGIVGEFGSGKSVTSYAVMRILDRAGKIAGGTISFSGIDVGHASDEAMADLRGREISMIFQNPRMALNPIRKVGDQIEDVLKRHAQATSADAGEKAIQALEQVRIARPRERYHAYPFELSGGMCQRVVIALALACNPQLLIADEPTTGLDVTTQKAVMDLVTELTRQRGMSTILITHDLGLAAAYCDRVVVMRQGEVVETAKSATIFRTPEHAYTRKLMRATPRPGMNLRDLLPEEEAAAAKPVVHETAAAAAAGDVLLSVEKLVKEYPRKGATSTLGKVFRRGPPVETEVFKRGGRHLVPDHARRKRRPGRRIRLRQIHHLHDGDAPAGPDRRAHRLQRRKHRRYPGQILRATAAAQAHPDGVPGSDRQPQPALHRGARDRRPDPAARRHPRPRRACARAARSLQHRWACRSNCSTAFRTSSPAARRPASASPARSRCIPT